MRISFNHHCGTAHTIDSYNRLCGWEGNVADTTAMPNVLGQQKLKKEIGQHVPIICRKVFLMPGEYAKPQAFPTGFACLYGINSLWRWHQHPWQVYTQECLLRYPNPGTFEGPPSFFWWVALKFLCLILAHISEATPVFRFLLGVIRD